MIVIAIDIDKAKVIYCVLDLDEKGAISTLKVDPPFLTLIDDKDSVGIRKFQTALFSIFDGIKPDKIVILTRQMKGRFKAASVSFKIEALIQSYKKVNVSFLSPQTIKAFFKKHDVDIPLEYGYQEDAVKCGYYILLQKEHAE